MSGIQPRRPMIHFTELDIPENSRIYRLEHYRYQNPWYTRLWRGKYTTRLLAIVHFADGGGAIYDITDKVPV
jgi:hypothetical protein